MASDSSSAPDPSLRVGYILKMFPRLSETFILNELLELERQGVSLSIFSLMFPQDGRFHGRLGTLDAAAIYLPRDKPETTWNRIWESEHTPPAWSRWDEARQFLHRWQIPKDLDLLLRAVAISSELEARGVQHVHAHFATVATQMAALVNILTGIPFSFTSHAKDIFRETVRRDLYVELVRRSTFNITVSDFNREFLLNEMPGIDSHKVIRLYNGVDLEYFSPAPKAPEDAVPHIISVGRLVPKKGFHVLLGALRRWKEEGYAFRASIVGDGEERERLLALRRQYELESEIELLGALPLERVRELCASATLLVLACVPDEIGNCDALPTTLLEALALDVPVVSTRLTGIPEIVGAEAGIVVPPADEGALAEGMKEVTRRLQRGELRGGAARRRAQRLFDLRQNVSRLRELFFESARKGSLP